GTFHRHAFTRHRPGDEECACFNSIWNNVVLRAVQLAHSFDDDPACASTFNLRSHFVEKIGQIADLRLLCRAFDNGRAFGKNGRHHDVVGPENSGTKLAAQIDDCAGEFRRKYFDIAAFDAHGGTECFKAL